MYNHDYHWWYNQWPWKFVSLHWNIKMQLYFMNYTKQTHTHTQSFNSRFTDYPGRPVPEETFTHSHPSWCQTSFIKFLHLLRSIASSLFSLRAWQSFSTTFLHVPFGHPFGLGPSTSYSMHFFTQSSSSFCSTCPYHRSLFCCNASAVSSIPNLSLSSHTHTHTHLTALFPDYLGEPVPER